MATVRISEDDSARDFAGLMARFRAGAEVLIEKDAVFPPLVLRMAGETPRDRLLSESIALAEARSKKLAYKPVMDADFAADLEER
jgi:hypothetical protein